MKTMHIDPGHGWLEVPAAELETLGILPKVSGYSYQKDGMVYLEEDCDLSLYLDKIGIDSCESYNKWAAENVVTKHTNYDSPVRSFARFRNL